MSDWDRLELSECMKAWGAYFDHSSSGALTKLARLVLRWAPRVLAMRETLRVIALRQCSRWGVPCGSCPTCLARAALEAEERAREAAGEPVPTSEAEPPWAYPPMSEDAEWRDGAVVSIHDPRLGVRIEDDQLVFSTEPEVRWPVADVRHLLARHDATRGER